MLTGINKKVELTANLAIIIVACVLTTVLIKSYLPPKDSTKTLSESESSERKNQFDNNPNVSSLGIDWKQSQQTLILAISSSCHYCTDSAAFYKKLAQRKGNTHLVAVLPQSVKEARNYLEKLGVSVDEIRSLSLDKIGVQGTPTIMLIDSSGTVKQYWIGRLSPEKEATVLESICKT